MSKKIMQINRNIVDTQVPLPKENELLTVNEVAVVLRLDPTTVRRWAKLGVLEVVVLPHRYNRRAIRIKRETLDKLLLGSKAS